MVYLFREQDENEKKIGRKNKEEQTGGDKKLLEQICSYVLIWRLYSCKGQNIAQRFSL